MVNELPLYQACMFLGAISPDHKDVQMSTDDLLRYYPKNQKIRKLATESKMSNGIFGQHRPGMKPGKPRNTKGA